MSENRTFSDIIRYKANTEKARLKQKLLSLVFKFTEKLHSYKSDQALERQFTLNKLLDPVLNLTELINCDDYASALKIIDEDILLLLQEISKEETFKDIQDILNELKAELEL